MPVSAAGPAASPRASVSYGHYEEGDARIQAQVYRGNLVVPIGDRLEFTYSASRDTYSGATPAYNIPATLAQQQKYKQTDDGRMASELTPTDVVSAASGRVTAGGLTILGGLNAYQSFVDNYAAVEAGVIAVNPRPPDPPAAPTIPGPVTIDFSAMNAPTGFSSYAGKANLAPAAGGLCSGTGLQGCYYEDGVAIGIVNDSSNPVAHLHRAGSVADRELQYHADSTGIYLRALDGSAFGLLSLDFEAPLDAAENPDSGAADFWEVMGFNTSVNPTLDTDTAFPTRVAYQTVANGFNGPLVLGADFLNINAFWITYNGYHQTPVDGKAYSVSIDNVALNSVAPVVAETPEQQAWAQLVSRETTIALYRSILESPVPAGTATVQKFQPQPREARDARDIGARYYFDHAVMSLNAGYSDEPDFSSSYGGMQLSYDLADRLTTFFGGYSFTTNDISRSSDTRLDHDSDHGGGHSHSEEDAAAYPDLDGQSHSHAFNIGGSRVLGKNTWLQATLTHTRQGGFLTNPYKLVYVRGEVTAEEYYDIFQSSGDAVDFRQYTSLEIAGIDLFRERRPDTRNQWSLSNRLNQYFPGADAALHADYRYYRDSWGIDAHTLDLSWHQNLPHAITLTPSLRYYSQSAADFYAPYFLSPRADGHYSSDFRLSGFGALSTGLNLRKLVANGISLDLGIEYYSHQGALKLGGGGEDDFADFDAYIAQAGLAIDLDAPIFASMASGQSAGDHAHHHGAEAPAGLMFTHGATAAGEWMFGYRYQWGLQSGDMREGSSSISDQQVATRGCGGGPCSSRPTRMNMHMHMLELMYAPTERLSLMLMPQLMAMDMELEPVGSGDGSDAHGGGHSSSGLGDTLLAAVFRLHDSDQHQWLAGLGLSAPTGSVDVTYSGEDGSKALQDYGMQLGSGTWDFRPSLSYLGRQARWSWGAQVNAAVRLEARNSAGYALGDLYQATAWGGYEITPWVSGSLRGVYTRQSAIKGGFSNPASDSAPVDFPQNYGGRHLDLGFGVNLHTQGENGSRHALGIEWLQPVADDYNGIQLERTGTLAVTWSYGL